MAPRYEDNLGKWKYDLVFPGAEYSHHRALVSGVRLVEAKGVDGRFTGAIRVFPGFADKTVHGVPSAGTAYLANVRTFPWRWQISGVDAQEYFLEIDPNYGVSNSNSHAHHQPTTVLINGVEATEGTAGSLAEGEWGWGNPDSQTFSTLYVRLPGGVDPDTQADGYIKMGGSLTIANVVLARYVSIQKGTSRHTLSGIVLLADSQGDAAHTSVSKSLYFAYKDSSDGSEALVELEDFDVWDDFRLTSLDDYDLASLGRYIYFAGAGDITSTVTEYNEGAPPYNKAYFWDFKVQDFDIVFPGIMGRFVGSMPERLLTKPLNSDDGGDLGTDAFSTSVDAGSDTIPAGAYSFGAQLKSRKHQLRSFVRFQSAYNAAAKQWQWDVHGATRQFNFPRIYQITPYSGLGALKVWGIPEYDGVTLYRSTVDSSDTSPANYKLVNLLRVCHPFFPGTDSALPVNTGIDHSKANNTFLTDGPLNVQDAFNPYIDSAGPAPRMKRIANWDNLLVGITSVTEPTTPDETWQEGEQKTESIVWSSTVAELENFPPENQYRPPDPNETFLSLEPAGDFMFPVGTSSIYRMMRNGSQVGINRVQFRLGGVSRWGQVGVGTSLFVVTRSGLKEIDGNSGGVRNIPVLDRIIQDKNEWGSSLSTVHMEYDASIGAIILLNTTKQECIFIWEGTGAVSRVVDCPWVFLTAGPDVANTGGHRVVFVTSTGKFHCVDGSGTMPKRTMCGTPGGSDTVNGTATAGTNDTNIYMTGATFTADMVGFKLYVLSGTAAGQSATITGLASPTQMTLGSGISGFVSGYRFSVAPVVFHVTLPNLTGEGAPDSFVRKQVKSLQVALGGLEGEYLDSEPNSFLTVGVEDQDAVSLVTNTTRLYTAPDRTKASVSIAGTRLFPYVESYASNLGFDMEAVLVQGVLSGSERESNAT